MGATAVLSNETAGADGDGFLAPGLVLVAGEDRFHPDAVVLAGRHDVVFSVEFVAELVARASAAVEGLHMLDPVLLSPDAVEVWAVGTEKVRRQVDAVGVTIAGHVDTAQRFRGDGFFTAKAWLKHRLKLSGVEAYRRVQTARMQARLPLWANAAAAGEVGVAQSELIGQVAAHPRLDPDTLHAGTWEIFLDAMDVSFKEFEANVRKWEKLADPDGASEQAERNRANRDANITPRDDGSWRLAASLDDVGGAEFSHIFGHFVQAEWDADWAEARGRVGDHANMLDLRRTQSQRRGDALLAMAKAAAACPPWCKRPLPAINVLIDHLSFESELLGERIDPLRYREVVCRTQSGHELLTADVARLALVAHVRRVVYDSAGVVIDLGRKQRLFTGSSREAVMLLATICAWVGCDAKAEWCHVDHSISWKAHGSTVPWNGGPLCCGHNLLKELGYRICRDEHGNWHTYHPDGHEIV